MKYFHATTESLNDGQILTSSNPSSFYPNATQAMDNNRPDNAPERRTSFYTADSPEFAYYFLLKQGKSKDEINVYRVETEPPWKAVFSLTHAIQKKLQNNESVSAAIDEYWSPTKEWKFFEYLSSSIKIIEKVEISTINETLMLVSYQNDFDRASKIS